MDICRYLLKVSRDEYDEQNLEEFKSLNKKLALRQATKSESLLQERNETRDKNNLRQRRHRARKKSDEIASGLRKDNGTLFRRKVCI
jgi:hypothetical protein